MTIFKRGTAKINELYLTGFGDACEVLSRLRALWVHKHIEILIKKNGVSKCRVIKQSPIKYIKLLSISTTKPMSQHQL